MCGVVMKFFLLCALGSCLLWSDAGAIQASIQAQIDECQKLEDDQPKAAIDLANQLLTAISRELEPLAYAQVLGCLGWSHATNNQPDLARIQANNLERLAGSLNLSAQSIKMLRRAGGIFHRIGDRISAAENYATGMEHAEQLALKSEQIPLLVNLGVLNSEIREHEQAIDNYYRALSLMEEIDDFRYQPPVLFNLAVTLIGQHRYAEGVKVFKQVEAMVNEHWPTSRTAQVYSGLGAAYAGVGDLVLAEDYAHKAYELLNQTDSRSSDYYNSVASLANILAKQEKSQAALVYADQAKNFYTNPVNREDIIGGTNPLHGLAGTYERLGELSQAIELFKLANDIDQEMQDSFNQETMVQMQKRLDDSEQREELATLKSQNSENQVKLKEAEHQRRIILILSLCGFVMVVGFVFWQHHSNRKLKRVSMTDSLTQLGNRRAIWSWLAKHPLPAPPSNRLLWLIDLDKFKQVNDDYDHDVGDHVLQQVAQSLLSLTNDQRFVGRWGGEEFMLISDDIEPEAVESFSEQLLQAIKNTVIEVRGFDKRLTASVGLCKLDAQDKSAWNKALYQADKALYTAKDRGRNCVVRATDTL